MEKQKWIQRIESFALHINLKQSITHHITTLVPCVWVNYVHNPPHWLHLQVNQLNKLSKFFEHILNYIALIQLIQKT